MRKFDNAHVDLQVWLGLCCDHTHNHGRVYVVYGPYHGVAVSRRRGLSYAYRISLTISSERSSVVEQMRLITKLPPLQLNRYLITKL